MNRIVEPKREDWAQILKRPTKTYEDLEKLVNKIFDDVRRNGDKALNYYTKMFDHVEIPEPKVSKKEINDATSKISKQLKNAILLAKENIQKFHESQWIVKQEVETSPGVICWQESRGIEKVGIYIPGGTAPLFSTVLMLAVPALIAGCKEIIICTPPDKNGNINPAILYTAKICGIDKIYKVGGIQAIGALTFGTESIPQVYKIFGPGNQFVTVAKQIASNRGVAIDIPAGPSELLVVADNSCIPEFVASDLLSQAEHGTDSQVVCLVNSEELIDKIEKQIKIQLEELPRKEIAKESIANSTFICISDKQTTIDIVNEYAPEHLILATKDNEFYVENVINVGSVFIGNYTPESAGDYASGTNHTLPTDGFAKMFSGVNLDSFTKKITFQKISKEGIQNIGNAIELMAEEEGLQAHKNAVSLRLNKK